MSLIKLFEDKNYILFRSDTSYKRNVIYFNSAAGLDRIGINNTFYPDPSHAPKDKPIDGIFTNNCMNEYSLISKKADWFQQETLNDFIKILKLNILGSEQETICYGSSMGGFASLHLAPLLEVKKVLAFSPQVSLNPEFGIRPTWCSATWARPRTLHPLMPSALGYVRSTAVSLLPRGRHSTLTSAPVRPPCSALTGQWANQTISSRCLTRNTIPITFK